MMKKVFLLLAVFVFVWTGFACGKGESKYIGKWVNKDRQVLEIRKDDTWSLSGTLTGGISGEWKIGEGPTKDSIVLYHGKSRIPAIFGEIEGENFINRMIGDVFERQDPKRAAAPAPAQPWTIYVSERKPKDYLELKSNGNFFMQEGDKQVEGKYGVAGNQVTLKIGPTFQVTGKIHGKTIIFENGDRWTKQEGAKPPPAKEEPTPAETPGPLAPAPQTPRPAEAPKRL